jgi:hypothetical protein
LDEVQAIEKWETVFELDKHVQHTILSNKEKY